METVYTLPEVADILRCSQTNVRKLLKSGELKSFSVSKSRLRVTQEQLLEFMKQGETE